MKIGKRLTASAFLPIVIALTVVFAEVKMEDQVDKTHGKLSVARGITTGVLELDLLTHAYLHDPGIRLKKEWESQLRSVNGILNKLEADPESSLLLSRMRQNCNSLSIVFHTLASRLERIPGAGEMVRLSPADHLLSEELRVKVRYISSDTERLADLFSRQLDSNMEKGTVFTIGSTFVISIFIMLTLLRINKQISGPIRSLREGTERIASGDLDYRVGTGSDDEIGELSRAFDRMTTDLKAITVSRDELTREIKERKLVETRLKHANEISELLNDLDTLIYSTIDIDQVMQLVIERTALAIGAEWAAIGVFEDEVFVFKYIYNPPEKIERSYSLKDLRGVTHMVSTREVLVFNDAPHDERLNRELVRKMGISSLLLAPLIVRDKVWGSLSFYAASYDFRFSELHVDFARKLAASLSLALENARLYSALKDSEQASRQHLSELQAIYATAPVGLCVVDIDFRFVSVNEKLVEITGLAVDQQLGRKVSEVLPDFADALEISYRAVIESGKPVEGVEAHGRTSSHPDVQRYWLVSHYPLKGADESIIGINTVIQDITERKRMEQTIKHQAHHDALTGLPNRRLFLDLVNLELAQARRHNKKVGVLFLDLDHFKKINDTLGHDAGDALLKAVSHRLKSSVREADTIARIGGDEFNILVADIAHVEDSAGVVNKILESFSPPFSVAGQQLHVTTSIGISIYPDDGEDLETLLRFADIAMYDAKESGRNTFRYFDPSKNARLLDRMRLENMLRQAVERGELKVYYQPLIEIDSKRLVSAEALVRWQHPEMGLLEPAFFIPLAEETGLITRIDQWVLTSICDQSKKWQEAGLPAIACTLNLSAREFQNPDLLKQVVQALDETGVSPHLLGIEITETTAMSNVERSVSKLRALSDMGIKISIDDFGTGYSSLSYLKQLPIQKLKIDKSFIRDIATDADDRAIISAMTAMAHTMRMRVIAEGVETEDQLAFLHSTGCDEAQGFFFSRPVPPEKFEKRMLLH